MSTYAALMSQMADQIRNALSAVTDVDVQIEPRLVWNPTPPTIDLYPGDPFLDAELAGFGEPDQPVFTVRARVQTADTDAGQDLLVALMDPEDELSVSVALEDDPTLDGLATDIYVQGQAGWAQYPDVSGQGALLGYQWRVAVMNARS